MVSGCAIACLANKLIKIIRYFKKDIAPAVTRPYFQEKMRHQVYNFVVPRQPNGTIL